MDIDKLESFVNSLGLDYHAEFVPFSKSRNKKEKPAIRDLCINWKVTISKGNCSLTVDYQEGIGLQAPTNRIIQDYNKVTIDEYNQLIRVLETGAGLKLNYMLDEDKLTYLQEMFQDY